MKLLFQLPKKMVYINHSQRMRYWCGTRYTNQVIKTFLKCIKSTKPDISENNLVSFLVCFIFIVTFDSFPNYLSVEFPLVVVYTAVQNNDDRRKLISQAIFFQF